MMSSQSPSADSTDNLLALVTSAGLQPEQLPALRQYQSAQAQGKMDVARRIKDNIVAFLRRCPDKE
jgi:hypothetical protein